MQIMAMANTLSCNDCDIIFRLDFLKIGLLHNWHILIYHSASSIVWHSLSHCETKIGLGIDSEQNLVWLCKGIKSVNKARKWFYLDIDFLNIALLQAYSFYDKS